MDGWEEGEGKVLLRTICRRHIFLDPGGYFFVALHLGAGVRFRDCPFHFQRKGKDNMHRNEKDGQSVRLEFRKRQVERSTIRTDKVCKGRQRPKLANELDVFHKIFEI